MDFSYLHSHLYVISTDWPVLHSFHVHSRALPLGGQARSPSSIKSLQSYLAEESDGRSHHRNIQPGAVHCDQDLPRPGELHHQQGGLLALLCLLSGGGTLGVAPGRGQSARPVIMCLLALLKNLDIHSLCIFRCFAPFSEHAKKINHRYVTFECKRRHFYIFF